MKDWEKRVRIAKAYGASPSTYAKVREEVVKDDKRYTSGAVWELHGETVLLVSEWDMENNEYILRNVRLNVFDPDPDPEGTQHQMVLGNLDGIALMQELRAEGKYHFHFGDDRNG